MKAKGARLARATARGTFLAAGTLTAAGLVVLWFWSKGYGYDVGGSYSCGPTGCHFPPPVAMVTPLIGWGLLGCAVTLLVVAAIPRLWPAGVLAGAAGIGLWWMVVFQRAIAYPPLPGEAFPFGSDLVLTGGVLAILSAVTFAVLRVRAHSSTLEFRSSGAHV
jgi:hypothetical protein